MKIPLSILIEKPEIRLDDLFWREFHHGLLRRIYIVLFVAR
jgi:hypothetical protein